MHGPSSCSNRSTVVDRLLAFAMGVSSDTLSAVPAAFIFYQEARFGMGSKFDPVTFARTRVPITNAHRIVACFNAIGTAAGYIVLPWSLAAGVVKHVASNRKRDNLGQQGNEGENT